MKSLQKTPKSCKAFFAYERLTLSDYGNKIQSLIDNVKRRDCVRYVMDKRAQNKIDLKQHDVKLLTRLSSLGITASTKDSFLETLSKRLSSIDNIYVQHESRLHKFRQNLDQNQKVYVEMNEWNMKWAVENGRKLSTQVKYLSHLSNDSVTAAYEAHCRQLDICHRHIHLGKDVLQSIEEEMANINEKKKGTIKAVLPIVADVTKQMDEIQQEISALFLLEREQKKLDQQLDVATNCYFESQQKLYL